MGEVRGSSGRHRPKFGRLCINCCGQLRSILAQHRPITAHVGPTPTLSWSTPALVLLCWKLAEFGPPAYFGPQLCVASQRFRLGILPDFEHLVRPVPCRPRRLAIVARAAAVGAAGPLGPFARLGAVVAGRRDRGASGSRGGNGRSSSVSGRAVYAMAQLVEGAIGRVAVVAECALCACSNLVRLQVRTQICSYTSLRYVQVSMTWTCNTSSNISNNITNIVTSNARHISCIHISVLYAIRAVDSMQYHIIQIIYTLYTLTQYT